jgi:hypothetical protein
MRDPALATFDPFAAAAVKQKITVEVRTILLFLSLSLFLNAGGSLQVISARQLPKVGSEQSEIIDPYVVVEMLGVDADTARVRTKTIGTETNEKTTHIASRMADRVGRCR